MIIVAGEALIDRITGPDGSVREVPGGGPYNTARTIARLGGEVAFLGQLSTDVRGLRLRDALRRDGIDLRWADATDHPTTLAVATLDAAGNARYVFESDGTSAADLARSTAEEALAAGPSALHVGTLGLVMEPIGSVLAGVVASMPTSTLLMVDPNCRPAATADHSSYVRRVQALVARADVVKVSADDLAFLDPGQATLDGARRLLDWGAQVVLLTDGGREVRIVTSASETSIPVPPLPVVDTIGAGDAFGGGFLAWWIGSGHQQDDLADAGALEEAVRYAVLVAGLSCGRAGADPPSAGEIGAVVAARTGTGPTLLP